MTEHVLKTWPEFFRAIVDGKKTFEVRKNDRGFQTGDVLHLREFDPKPPHVIRTERRIVRHQGWLRGDGHQAHERDAMTEQRNGARSDAETLRRAVEILREHRVYQITAHNVFGVTARLFGECESMFCADPGAVIDLKRKDCP